MPPPLPITFAQARLQGWEVWCHCRDCRMWRPIKLDDMVVSPFDNVQIGDLTRWRKFYCHKCRGKRVSIHVNRAKVGVTELVEAFEQE